MNHFKLFRYRLPLIAPLHCGDQQLSMREGLLICREVDGRETWAEAAPLLGFSCESMPQIIDAARRRAWNAYPSLQFAYACLKGRPVHGQLAVSALLMDAQTDPFRASDRVGELPHTTIKIKVARNVPVQQDIQRVLAVIGALRPEQRLRLDANRGWNYDQSVHFARAVEGAPIDFVEEPTDTPADFERLHKHTGLRYALDETLRETTDLTPFPQAAALIIKPTLMGTQGPLEKWAKASVPLVFSSAFESGIGLRHIARLALRYSPHIPVGLDTYRWLAADVVTPRLVMDNGRFDLHDAWQIDHSCLEELPP